MKSIKIVTVILIIMMLFIMVKPTYATIPIDPGLEEQPDTTGGESSGKINPDKYMPPNTVGVKDAEKLKNIGIKMISAVSTIGMIVVTLTFAVLGIKYMLGSVEEKSEFKKDFGKYLIGATIIFGITTILGFISFLARNIAII